MQEKLENIFLSVHGTPVGGTTKPWLKSVQELPVCVQSISVVILIKKVNNWKVFQCTFDDRTIKISAKNCGTLSNIYKKRATIQERWCCNETFSIQWFQMQTTLLCEVTINSICKCFVCFFYPHLRIKSKTKPIEGICFRM